MATAWIYRLNVICAATDRTALNALWTMVAPDGDAEFDTFGAPLSPDGNNPVTHYGISSAATEEMNLLVTQTFAEDLNGSVVSIQPYTQNNWESFLQGHGLQAVRSNV